ncbi:MAG: lysylphosphatidylglycerol synthase transmembrane domain-containing protein [Chloroflexota bacterium]
MKARLVLGLLSSVAFVALLLRGVNLGDLLQHILSLNVLFILPAMAAYFLGVWLRALRWQRLLEPVAAVSARRLNVVELIGFGVNNVLPVRLGEVLRAWLVLRSHGVPAAATLGSIVVERILDGLFLCLILLTGLLSLPLEDWMRQGVILAATAFGLATVGIFVAALAPRFVTGCLGLVLRPASTHLRDLVLKHAAAFLEGFATLRRVSVLVPVLGLTVACWLAEASVYWLLLIGFALPVGLGGAMLGMSAANLATIIPSSPGYVGTFHLPLQSVLSSGFGIGQAEAAAYAIVTHAVLVLPIAVLGIILLAREGLSLSAVQQRAGRLRQEIRGRPVEPPHPEPASGSVQS